MFHRTYLWIIPLILYIKWRYYIKSTFLSFISQHNFFHASSNLPWQPLGRAKAPALKVSPIVVNKRKTKNLDWILFARRRILTSHRKWFPELLSRSTVYGHRKVHLLLLKDTQPFHSEDFSQTPLGVVCIGEKLKCLITRSFSAGQQVSFKNKTDSVLSSASSVCAHWKPQRSLAAAVSLQ